MQNVELDIKSIKNKEDMRMRIMKGDLGEYKIPSDVQLKDFNLNHRFPELINSIGNKIIDAPVDHSMMLIK